MKREQRQGQEFKILVIIGYAKAGIRSLKERGIRTSQDRADWGFFRNILAQYGY